MRKIKKKKVFLAQLFLCKILFCTYNNRCNKFPKKKEKEIIVDITQC